MIVSAKPFEVPSNLIVDVSPLIDLSSVIKISDIKLSRSLGADCVELHVGKFCRMINNNKYSKLTFLKLWRLVTLIIFPKGLTS